MIRNKIISFILLIITLASTFMPILQTISNATTYTVEYYGTVNYGLSTVGNFRVNGQQAFCMDHKKTTPPSGTSVEENVYDDDNIIKCLYYGWNGAEPYPFSSEAQGIVYTTLALDHFKNGNTNNTAKDFIDYIYSKGVPSITLDIANKNLTAYLDGDTQRTESTTVTGESGRAITIPLQEGVSLVNETRGTTETGNVNVYGGDTFYLRAPLTVNGSWTSNNITNCKYKFQPIVYLTSSSSHQDLAGGYRVVEDPSLAINLSVNWLSMGNIEISKKDDETGAGIPNTTFELRNSNDEVIETVTTDSTGHAKILNLFPGQYKLVETSSNNLYLKGNTPQEITLNAGETKNIEITNEHKKGCLRIIKVDSRNETIPIAGVTFEIWNDELSKLVATKTTSSTGEIFIDNLRTGTYTIRETDSVDKRYKLDTTGKKVTIDYNQTSTLTVKNDIKQAYLSITKQDTDYKNLKLNNVKFEIRDQNENLIQTLITDEHGFAKSKALDIDKSYKIVEISTIPNYVLNTKIINVEFTPNDEDKTINYTIDNLHEKGNLQILKVDSRNHNIPIEGATFEIWNKEMNELIATKTSDKDGAIKIDNLRTGEYLVKEISLSNDWYKLDTTARTITVKYDKTAYLTVPNDIKQAYVSINKIDAEYNDIKIKDARFEIRDEDNNLIQTLITDENGFAKSSGLDIDKKYTLKEAESNEKYILNEKTETITFTPADEEKTFSYTFENEHKKGDLKVYKVDKDNHKIALGNVTFDLYSDEFNKIIGTYTTNVDGEIEVKDLRVGNYRLIERNTGKWYNLADDKSVEVIWNTTSENYVENELKKSQIRVIKVDQDNNEIRIAGVKFEVIDEDNNVLEELITDQNGEAITKKYIVRDFKKLKLRETETQEAYALNDEIKEVELKANEIVDVTIENELKKGQIKIIKVDLDNNEIKLENVKFDILDEMGNIVDQVITDSNGEATTKRLPIYNHEYTAVETETRKEYKLTEETQTVVLKQDEIKDLIFENEKLKGEIEVYKVDAEDNKILLEGVEFEVINSDGKVIETIKTNKNGYAKTSRIPIGEYFIKETKSDDKHLINEETFKLEVKADKITTIQIENERIKGQIRIIKTSEDDNFINGEKAGTPISNVKFEIYDTNNNLVDEIVTGEDGTAITKILDKDHYKILETESGEWYQLNTNEIWVDIEYDGQIVDVKITNESDKPDIDIEKTGIIQTTANQEIKYDFKFANTGNVPLSNFTWTDELPTDYVRITKLITGTYNQDLNYNIYYKTNLNDYKLLADNLNSKTNHYIDFTSIDLAEGEYVTNFKIDFGKVNVGFTSEINPYIFVKTLNSVKKDDTFTNKTRIEGDHKGYLVWDEDDHTTKVYEKEITVKKLPRTGF